jgi:DNA-binding NtrC family response regulator
MRRILVVDDDRQMVRTICDILKLRGWDADGAFSGEEAIERVKAQPYRIALMDVRMAGMNGVEAMKSLRASRPELRVILMTAYTASELLAEAEREGAVRILAKPVAVPNLLDMLEQELAGAPVILVVDDDRQFLTTLSATLRQHGYATLEAQDLDQALKQLEESHPSAVLLDLFLNGITPPESVLAIRRMSPAVVIILYSGHTAALEDATASMPNSWVLATLQKPFAPDRLLAMLDEFVTS